MGEAAGGGTRRKEGGEGRGREAVVARRGRRGTLDSHCQG